MSCGDNAIPTEVLQRVQASGDNPFAMVNADGRPLAFLQENHIETINQTALESLQNGVRGCHHHNFWGVLCGESGAGKTHLLYMLQEWARKEKIFVMWVSSYCGPKFFNTYLGRGILEKLVETPGFSAAANSNHPNILQEMTFPLFRQAIVDLLTRGDPDWPAKLCRDVSLWQKLFGNQEKNKNEFLKQVKSWDTFAALLPQLDIEKLVRLVFQRYKSNLPPDTGDIFCALLKLALQLDAEQQEMVFQRLLRQKPVSLETETDVEEDVEEEKAIAQDYPALLVSAICYVISLGKIPVCILLDQFEAIYNALEKQCLQGDREEQDKQFAILLNSLFHNFAAFFNSPANIALVLSCRPQQWTEINGKLDIQTLRRIQQPPYNLLLPTPAEIESLVQKRMSCFWKKYGHQPLDPYFPFDADSIRQVVEKHQRVLRSILPELRQEFNQRFAPPTSPQEQQPSAPEPGAIQTPAHPTEASEQELVNHLEQLRTNHQNLAVVCDQLLTNEVCPSIEVCQYLQEIRRDLPQQTNYLMERLEKMLSSDLRRNQWARMIHTRQIPVAAIRENLLMYHQIDTYELSASDAKYTFIDKLGDKELSDFVAGWYSGASLGDIARRYGSTPTTGAKWRIIRGILKPYIYQKNKGDIDAESDTGAWDKTAIASQQEPAEAGSQPLTGNDNPTTPPQADGKTPQPQ